MRRLRAIGRCAMAVIGCIMAAGPALAQGQPSVVVVFDGSGSMWSKLGGSSASRLVGARDAVKAALADMKRPMTASLVAFGHRQQGSCTDIQTLVPLDGGDNARLTPFLDKLNPRGKGPFVQAVREAAGLLKGAKGDRHILLIHDDPDNCQQDPCAAAREIAAADPELKIHVVSIAMRADDPGRPLCMARTTGGKALLSETAADLTRDVADILVTVALAPVPAAPVAAAPTPKPAPVAVAPSRPAVVVESTPKSYAKRSVPTTGPPRLLLGARLTSGGPLIELPVSWMITAADGKLTTGGAVVGAAPEVALGAGRYSVTVDTGAMTMTAPVDVKPEGATELVIDLNAALVRVMGAVKRGGPPSATTALTIRRPGPEGSVLWIGFSATDGVIVPAGEIVAIAADGAAKAEQAMTAEAGRVVDIVLPLESGHLKLAAVARDGGPPLGDVVYRVLEDDPEASRGRREVARSSAAAPDLVLPAGAYVIAASNGGAEVRERVVIRPGEEVSKVVVIGVARVRFNVRAGGLPNAVAVPVAYAFRRLDAEAPDVTGSTDRSPVAAVNPGRYRIEIRVGEQNARLQQDVDIRPGTDIVVTQTIPAARVEFAMADRVAIAAGGDILWDLTTATGQRVWRSMQSRPRLLLAPGAYTMTLEARGVKSTKRFDVAAGELKVEFGLE